MRAYSIAAVRVAPKFADRDVKPSAIARAPSDAFQHAVSRDLLAGCESHPRHWPESEFAGWYSPRGYSFGFELIQSMSLVRSHRHIAVAGEFEKVLGWPCHPGMCKFRSHRRLHLLAKSYCPADLISVFSRPPSVRGSGLSTSLAVSPLDTANPTGITIYDWCPAFMPRQPRCPNGSRALFSRCRCAGRGWRGAAPARRPRG